MSLRFVIGPAGSGKTYHCLSRLRERERSGRAGIYLVPEQFTYSADRELLAADDMMGLRHVRVFSFTRLVWWLQERAGVTPPESIDPAVRPMYLRAVLEQMGPESLGPLASLRRRQGMLGQLGRFVGEVRNHGTVEFLTRIQELSGDREIPGSVRDKLSVLGRVVGEYSRLLRDRGRMDPEEHLFGAAPLLERESGFLAGCAVYVDGFLSWTAREREILLGLARHAESVDVVFCCDDPGANAKAKANANADADSDSDSDSDSASDSDSDSGSDSDSDSDSGSESDSDSGSESDSESARLPFRPVHRSLKTLETEVLRAGLPLPDRMVLPDGNPIRFQVGSLRLLEREIYAFGARPEGAASSNPTPNHAAPGSAEPVNAEPGSAAPVNAEPSNAAPSGGTPSRLAAAKSASPDATPSLSAGLSDLPLFAQAAEVAAAPSNDPEPAHETSGPPEPQAPESQAAGGLPVSVAMERDAITLRAARDPEHEVRAWARTIDRWIRLDPDGFRPEEVAVVVRDIAPYRDSVSRIFPQYGIPFFLDERRSVLAHPRVRLLLGALDVLQSRWRRDSVVSVLRNPLLRIALSSIDLLENTSLESGRNFERWYDETPWEPLGHLQRSRFTGTSGEVIFDPELYDPDADLSDSTTVEEGPDDEELLTARSTHHPQAPHPDEIRRTYLLPLRQLEVFWAEDGWTGGDVAAGLARLMDEWAGHQMPSNSEWDRRVAVALTDLLSELAHLWADIPVEADEVSRALRDGLLTLRLGVTPVRPGQVVVADIQRSRLHGIRGLIVGGVNEGRFPRTIAEDGVLGEADRAALDRLGLSLGPSATERQEEEAYLFYIALTRASERIELTWTGSDADGSESQPSVLLREITRLLPQTETCIEPWRETELPWSEVQRGAELSAAVLGRLSSWLKGPDEDPELMAFWSEMREGSGTERPLCLPVGHSTSLPTTGRPMEQAEDLFARGIRGLFWTPEDFLPEELAAFAFPDPMVSSVSRLQEFAVCPFQSFAKSLLELNPRPEARITPLETGTLAHDVLDRFFSDPDGYGAVAGTGVGVGGVDVATIDRKLGRIFEDLADLPDYRAFSIDRSSRYRWESTRRSLVRFLRVELARLEASPFQVDGTEVSFGFQGVAPLELPLADGATLLIRGRIDRVDIRENDGTPKAVVIDYKRSSRTGLPGRLERGLDLQLGTYLLYARNQLGFDPVAGLYIPVLPSPPRDEKSKPETKNELGLKAHGLFLKEETKNIDGRTELLASRSPDQCLDGPEEMNTLLDTTAHFLQTYAENQRSGRISALPLQSEPARLPCDRCDYHAVCRFPKDTGARRRRSVEGMQVSRGGEAEGARM